MSKSRTNAKEQLVTLVVIVMAIGCLLTATSCKVSSPGRVESTVAKEMKHKITVGGKGVKNPFPATDETISQGKEHFGHHCGICHGLDGQATGVPFADKMSPPIPSLASSDVQDYEDGQLKWIIENGINPSGMPSWMGILDDEEMWKIVDFIRHLPTKGSLGIPEVFEEEKEKHQHVQGQGRHSAPEHEHKHP